MDSKIKFSVEGIQVLRDDMSKVLKDTITQSKLLIETNKEFVGILQQQIKLLRERRELMGPTGSSVVSGGSAISPPSGTITGLNVPGTDQPITRNQGEIKRTIQQLSQAILDQKRLVDGTKDYIQQQKQLLEKTHDVNQRKVIQDEIREAKKALNEDQGDLRELQRKREQANLDAREAPKRAPGGSNIRPSMIQSLGTAMLINPINSSDPVQGAMGAGQNISSMMMMSGGKMGWVGLGLGLGVGLAGAQVQLLREIMPHASRVARLRGGQLESYLESNNRYSDLGYTRSQVLENRAGAIKALGIDSSSNLSTMLALQKGFDVSQGDLTGLMRAGRGDKNFDLQRVFSNTYAGLQYAGLGKEKTEAFIPEYLKILTELGQKQLESLGKVDYGVNTRILSVFSSAGNRLRNPDTVRGVVNDFYQGLTNASSPQVEALQFQALGKAFPGKSLWQLEKIREEPFSESNMKYTEGFLQNLKGVSSSKEDLERTISQVFFGGGKKNLSEEIATLLNKPGGIFDIKKVLDEQGITQQQVYERALGAVDRFDKLVAKWEEVKFTNATEKLSTAMDDLAEKLDLVNLSIDKKVIPAIQSSLLLHPFLTFAKFMR